MHISEAVGSRQLGTLLKGTLAMNAKGMCCAVPLPVAFYCTILLRWGKLLLYCNVFCKLAIEKIQFGYIQIIQLFRLYSARSWRLLSTRVNSIEILAFSHTLHATLFKILVRSSRS